MKFGLMCCVFLQFSIAHSIGYCQGLPLKISITSQYKDEFRGGLLYVNGDSIIINNDGISYIDISLFKPDSTYKILINTKKYLYILRVDGLYFKFSTWELKFLGRKNNSHKYINYYHGGYCYQNSLRYSGKTRDKRKTLVDAIYSPNLE